MEGGEGSSSNSIAHVVQTLDLLEFFLITGAILRRGGFFLGLLDRFSASSATGGYPSWVFTRLEK